MSTNKNAFNTIVELAAAEAKKHFVNFMTDLAAAISDNTAPAKKAVAAPAAEEAPEDVEPTPATETTDKVPVAKKEGERNRSTDAELVVKFTAQLAEAKAKKAPKEKIAEIQAKLTKYTEKVKAAGKSVPTVETEPSEEAPKAKAPAATKKADPVKAPPSAWNGKCGIIPVKVGDAVILEADDFEDFGGKMKCRVVEIGINKVKVFPAALESEPNIDGELAATVDESPFDAAWVDVNPDGSNIKLVKKATFGKK